MDKVLSVFLIFLFVVALIALVCLLIWIVLALLLRFLSFLVFYVLIAIVVAAAAGILAGVFLPWRHLRGFGSLPLKNLTPRDVKNGTVFALGVPGITKHYGWDEAWPLYLPYQARVDASGVRREVSAHVRRAWAISQGFVVRSDRSSGAEAEARLLPWIVTACRSLVSRLPTVFTVPIVLVPFVGYVAGLWLSAAAWWGGVHVLATVWDLFQKLVLAGFRAHDILTRRRRRATMACQECHFTTTTPSYRCSNADCSVIHRRLLPGPLGLFWRRCACGTLLPNTITGAAKRLTAVCPQKGCEAVLPTGSGSRQVVRVPIIGAVGAGKTRYLSQATISLRDYLTDRNGSLKAGNDDSAVALAEMERVVRQRVPTSKTPDGGRPRALPFVLTRDQHSVELYMIDAAGESFSAMERIRDLPYLRGAPAVLLVLDPFGFERPAAELAASDILETVLRVEEDQWDVFRFSSEVMRHDLGGRRRRCYLGVVVSKADVLSRQPCGRHAEESAKTSHGVRAWLVEIGGGPLVDLMERQFDPVEYFLVDSFEDRAQRDPQSPLRPLARVLEVNRSAITVTQPHASARDEEGGR